MSRPNLHVALIHHPVVSKNGDTIASAVTNLDLHDIARTAKTYGVRSFYVVTPLEDQAELVDKIVAHWVTGAGGDYNPSRREALLLIRQKGSYAEVLDDIRQQEVAEPITVATSARATPPLLSFEKFRGLLDKGAPAVLALGTAWGLAQTFMEEADHVLEPVKGGTNYNHLPVRSAAAIILDRVLGCRGTVGSRE